MRTLVIVALVLLLALTVVATACSPAASGQRTLEPASNIAAPTSSVSALTPTPSATPPTTPAPTLTPVPRKMTGRATVMTTGAAVAGVRIRVSPMPINDRRVPGPDATAVTDESGVYTLTVLTWPPEALASSSSFQAMLEVTPPPGLLVLDVSKVLGGPPGTTGGMLLGDLSGPIDITLGPGYIVEGKITSGVTGTPLAGIGVNALGPNSIFIHGGAGDAFEIEATATTDTTGKYRLTVRSGTHVIQAYGAQDDQQRFWSDDPAVFQATLLRVERDVAGIDIAVVPVTRIGGYVRSGPSFGDGVAGTRVAAYLAGGTPCCRTVGVAITGYGGTFLMFIPKGSYRLVFDPPAGSPFAAQWWSGAAGFATATDVIVGTAAIQLEVELGRLRP
jgi:hypothetical protein